MTDTSLIGTIVKPTSKGQMTIPLDIRRELSISEETFLNVVKKDNGFLVKPVEKVLRGKKLKKKKEMKILTPARRKRLLKLLKEVKGIFPDLPPGDEYVRRIRRRSADLARLKKMREFTF